MDDTITISKDDYEQFKKYSWTTEQVGLYAVISFAVGVVITLLYLKG